VACCSVQTPITALLAFDVACCDWCSIPSDRFVMVSSADQYRFRVRITLSRKEQSGRIRKIPSKNVTGTGVLCATARKMVLQQFALGHARMAKRRGVAPQGYPSLHAYAKAGRCS